MAEVIGKVVLAIGIAVGMCLILTFPMMWLWNWLMPHVFHLPTLNFWETFGVMVLCQFLFKSSTGK